MLYVYLQHSFEVCERQEKCLPQPQILVIMNELSLTQEQGIQYKA